MSSKLERNEVEGPIIIGAGPSGLATAACLQEKGVTEVVVLEREDCIASLWKLKTYSNLRLHLPKKFCELPHMVLPEELPAYPTKQQFITYLEDYAVRFNIMPKFKQEVQLANYDAKTGLWRVQTNEFEFVSKWLIVAIGENSEPVLPKIEGILDFQGRVLHTSSYRDGAQFEGEKVLVVGCGNSGMEVGLDLCHSGAQVSMVIRDKLHIIPREMFGRSTFGVSMWLLNWFPRNLVDWLLVLYSRFIFGDIRRFGIERPDVGPLELKSASGKTPVLDFGTVAKIKGGLIKVVPGIRKFTTNGSTFVDGSARDFDSIILATGYTHNVPSWLKEEEFFSNKEGDSWKRNNRLYTVGFTKKGLLGVSMDARKVAEDIARQWNSGKALKQGLVTEVAEGNGI
ncbi:hypothetical protein GIB67_017483 [Kingdonia uniflora]|uniref:indole-3-pyruvate monooxygenase n=1 Tax=Kingdonia uniflora TaxID=39325 RepID=A0A7J7M4K5_9MAGN|nr:hypothetical protein GIB67_017483 [Kingdonia uniflora]